MDTYQKLFDYIDYFKCLSEEKAFVWVGGNQNENGVITMGYPMYDQRFKDFIDDAYNSGILDTNYVSTLEKYQLEMSDELVERIDSANVEQTKAILTCYIRQERFSEGVWATAIRDRVFYKVLIRLKQLQADGQS